MTHPALNQPLTVSCLISSSKHNIFPINETEMPDIISLTLINLNLSSRPAACIQLVTLAPLWYAWNFLTFISFKNIFDLWEHENHQQHQTTDKKTQILFHFQSINIRVLRAHFFYLWDLKIDFWSRSEYTIVQLRCLIRVELFLNFRFVQEIFLILQHQKCIFCSFPLKLFGSFSFLFVYI